MKRADVTPATGAARKDGVLVASAIIVLLFILSAAGGAFRKPITEGFDEVAHVSYVAHIQDHPGWPRLEQMRMVDPATFKFTSEANYLNHPPVYYWIVAAFGPQVREHPGSLIYLRLLNIVIAALGLGALLALAARMELRGLEFYAFVVMIATTPVLAPLAGSVNNDNLSFAGGAFTILGAYAFVASQRRSWLIVACCGMLVAGASKLTGLLLCGGFLAALLALLIWKRASNRMDIGIFVIGLVAAAMPYIAFTLQYGGPAPDTPAQIELLRHGASVAGWAAAPRMDALSYTIVFLKSFVSEWMPSLQPRNSFQLALLILPSTVLVLAAAGTALSLRAVLTGRGEASAPVVVTGMLAMAATLAIHVMFSYERHLQTGWMMDAYPRYYLPMIAVVPMAAIALAKAIGSPGARAMLLTFLIAAPLIFGLFGAPLG